MQCSLSQFPQSLCCKRIKKLQTVSIDLTDSNNAKEAQIKQRQQRHPHYDPISYEHVIPI